MGILKELFSKPIYENGIVGDIRLTKETKQNKRAEVIEQCIAKVETALAKLNKVFETKE